MPAQWDLLRGDDAADRVTARENDSATINFVRRLLRGLGEFSAGDERTPARGAPIGVDSLPQNGPALCADAFHN